ncbi:hypothetical protein A5692_18835 [Mycobacterium sp. E342]|nr:hypothetical protein A5692_18835 [Mycobacterium sp. E342]
MLFCPLPQILEILRRTHFPDVWSIANRQFLKHSTDIVPAGAAGTAGIRFTVATVLFPDTIDSADMAVAGGRGSIVGGFCGNVSRIPATAAAILLATC